MMKAAGSAAAPPRIPCRDPLRRHLHVSCRSRQDRSRRTRPRSKSRVWLFSDMLLVGMKEEDGRFAIDASLALKGAAVESLSN